MPLEDGFDPTPPKTKLLEFDAAEMDRDVYSELHRDIRTWVSQRVRHVEEKIRGGWGHPSTIRKTS